MSKKVDVFPAVIYLAPPDSLENYRDLHMKGEHPSKTRRVDRSRIAILNDVIYVAVDAPEGPKLVFKEGLAAYERDATLNEHHALTVSAKIIVFGKDENCGCGSRLRSWNPFGSVLNSTEDPSE